MINTEEMSINERMFLLMQEKDIKPSNIADSLNIGRGVVSTWKTRKTDPPAKYIIQISELLDVSPIYLLNGKKEEIRICDYNSNLRPGDVEIIEKWQSLSYENQAIIRGKIFEIEKEQIKENQKKYSYEKVAESSS